MFLDSLTFTVDETGTGDNPRNRTQQAAEGHDNLKIKTKTIEKTCSKTTCEVFFFKENNLFNICQFYDNCIVDYFLHTYIVATKNTHLYVVSIDGSRPILLPMLIIQGRENTCPPTVMDNVQQITGCSRQAWARFWHLHLWQHVLNVL